MGTLPYNWDLREYNRLAKPIMLSMPFLRALPMQARAASSKMKAYPAIGSAIRFSAFQLPKQDHTFYNLAHSRKEDQR